MSDNFSIPSTILDDKPIQFDTDTENPFLCYLPTDNDQILLNFKVVNVENTGKGFGFVRIENDRGFHVLNQLVTNVGNYSFQGRRLKVELR